MAFVVGRSRLHVVVRALALVAVVIGVVVFRTDGSGADLASGEPYAVEAAVDTNPAADVFETTIVAKAVTRDIGNGVQADMWTYNGIVPGPEIRVNVGDTVVVHFRNELPRASSIHWHGIELANASDGTSLTQNGVKPGESFLYRFKVPRPGIFWYHPHHNPTNPVFRGQYGSLIVADPHEETLRQHGVLPPRERTKTVVLSDTTVCKAPGTNDARTYDRTLPWAGGGPLPEQRQPWPTTLCDTPVDDNGNPIKDAAGRPIPLPKGAIPNIQRFAIASQGRTNEGQTVLANGRNTGGRRGSPETPGEVAEGATRLSMAAGEGLRIQAINAATVRYFRLRLTDANGNQIPLVRIGAEGGLLDQARLEGGRVGGTGINTVNPYDNKYALGELLLSPSDRSDFVIAVPSDAPIGVATLWTLDYLRTGEDFTYTPTVPVMHLDIRPPTGAAYTIAPGTPLRTHPSVMDPVEVLGPPRTVLPDLSGQMRPLLDPATFDPPKPGSANEDIQLTTDSITHGPGIDRVEGKHDFGEGDYTTKPRTASTRYAALGDLLELTVTNTTAAHHAFHLHGFSFQPLAYEGIQNGFPPRPSYVFDYAEFVDTIDIPPQFTFRFRVRLDDRPLMDGTTPGGGTGRWVLHCHIFFHSTHGMHAELIVVAPDGNEKPFVDTSKAAIAVREGETATVTGTYSDPDRDPVSLSASEGVVEDLGGGRWTWRYSATDGKVGRRTAYVTATDSNGLRSQTAFAVDVENVAPSLAMLAPPSGSGHPVGSPVTVVAAMSDPGPPSRLSCRFDWDDGSGAGEPVPVVDGRCSASRTFAAAGVHTVAVTASDGNGGIASGTTRVAAFDVGGGSVTGSGVVDSASFEVAARYLRGATVPQAEVAFTTGAFAFQATAADWLVVSGNAAQVQGVGTVDGVGGHRFLLTVVDDGRGDRLRLSVWDAAGAVVYDNRPGAPLDLDVADPPPITSGSVVIHRNS